jgi:hypothetical protein
MGVSNFDCLFFSFLRCQTRKVVPLSKGPAAPQEVASKGEEDLRHHVFYRRVPDPRNLMGSACCVHCRLCSADDHQHGIDDSVGDSDDSSNCNRSGNSSRRTLQSNPRVHLHSTTLPTVVRVPQTSHPHDVPSQQPAEQEPDNRQAQLALSRNSGGLERLSSAGTQDPFSLDSSGGTLLASARRLSYATCAAPQHSTVTAVDGSRVNPLDVANLTPRTRQRMIAKSKEDAMESHRQLLEQAMKAINDASATVSTKPPRVKATTNATSPLPQFTSNTGRQPTITFGDGSHPPTHGGNTTNSRCGPDEDEPLVLASSIKPAAPKPTGDEFSMSSADSSQSLISSQHLIGASTTSTFISAGPMPSDHRGLAKMDGKSRRASAAPKGGSSVYNASSSGTHGLHASASLSRDDRGPEESTIPENSILERSFDAGNMVGIRSGSPGDDDHDTQNSSMLEVSVRNSFDQYLIDHMMKLNNNAKVTWFHGTSFSREQLRKRERKGSIRFNSLVTVVEVTGGPYGGQLNESRTSSLTLSQTSSSLAATLGPERQLSGNYSTQKPTYQTHVPAFPLQRKRNTLELSVLIEASVTHENQLAKRLPPATAFVFQI